MFDGEHTIEHTDIELYCTTEVYVISPSYLALEGKKVCQWILAALNQNPNPLPLPPWQLLHPHPSTLTS